VSNAHGLNSVLKLIRDGLRWLDTKWCLHEVYRRRDFLGDDLPKLIINEREYRP
jgi:hypothetical protein